MEEGGDGSERCHPSVRRKGPTRDTSEHLFCSQQLGEELRATLAAELQAPYLRSKTRERTAQGWRGRRLGLKGGSGPIVGREQKPVPPPVAAPPKREEDK